MYKKTSIKYFFFFLSILILLNCSNKKSIDKEIPIKPEEIEENFRVNSYSITIDIIDTKIKATVNGFDPSKYEIEWFVNGVFVLRGTLVFDIKEVKKGDVIKARTIINGREINSNEIIIGNNPPKLDKVKMMPESFKLGDTFYVDARAFDPDGDDVNIICEWYKNGEFVNKGMSINSNIKRGDKIIVKIKPYDGKSYGEEVVLEREILNIPPIIIEHKEYKFEKNIFTYQIKAEDPDGDPLIYSLKSAPSGMTINNTGLIEWKVPDEFKGKVPVTVSVIDGHGGEVLYNFEVSINL